MISQTKWYNMKYYTVRNIQSLANKETVEVASVEAIVCAFQICSSAVNNMAL